MALSAPLFGGDQRLAWPEAVVRGAAPSRRGLAREPDQVVREEHRADEMLQLAAPQPRPRETPEHAAVIPLDANQPEYAGHHGQAALDVAPGGALPGVRRIDAVLVGAANLPFVARDEVFRGISDAHALAPHRPHPLIWDPERHVGFPAPPVLDQGPPTLWAGPP